MTLLLRPPPFVLDCVLNGEVWLCCRLRVWGPRQAKSHLDCGALLDWAPVIDQVELTAHPRVLAAAGKIHDVPIIFGTNRDEGTLFVDAPCVSRLPCVASRTGFRLTTALVSLSSPLWLALFLVCFRLALSSCGCAFPLFLLAGTAPNHAVLLGACTLVPRVVVDTGYAFT